MHPLLNCEPPVHALQDEQVVAGVAAMQQWKAQRDSIKQRIDKELAALERLFDDE